MSGRIRSFSISCEYRAITVRLAVSGHQCRLRDHSAHVGGHPHVDHYAADHVDGGQSPSEYGRHLADSLRPVVRQHSDVPFPLGQWFVHRPFLAAWLGRQFRMELRIPASWRRSVRRHAVANRVRCGTGTVLRNPAKSANNVFLFPRLRPAVRTAFLRIATCCPPQGSIAAARWPQRSQLLLAKRWVPCGSARWERSTSA